MIEGFPKKPRKIRGLIFIDKETGMPVDVPSKKDYEEYEEVMKIHTVYDRRIRSSFQAYIEDCVEKLLEKSDEEITQWVRSTMLKLHSMPAVRGISDVPSKDWDAGKRLIFLSEVKTP